MADAVDVRRDRAAMRRLWLLASVIATLGPFVLAVWLAPAAGAEPVPALSWLLFVSSSMHVAATGWFYTVPEVRAHMATHRGRYLWAPAALIVGLAVAIPLLPTRAFTAVLLVFFAWQFFHFQKQNLGVAALAARATGAANLAVRERQALVAAGIGGIAGVLGRPRLLEIGTRDHSGLLSPVGAIVFAAACLLGIRSVLTRTAPRPPAFVVLYLSGLLFFLPVFVFDSPYAAVAGLTIAHGMQYLLLIALLAGAPAPDRSTGVGLLALMNLTLVLGIALNRASHLHDSTGLGRAVFGAYLGVSAAHFVIDAGLWRLRDEFPRAFLTERLPYLLAVPPATARRAG